jgi:Skp family chaperone for outer membrane proteins
MRLNSGGAEIGHMKKTRTLVDAVILVGLAAAAASLVWLPTFAQESTAAKPASEGSDKPNEQAPDQSGSEAIDKAKEATDEAIEAAKQAILEEIDRGKHRASAALESNKEATKNARDMLDKASEATREVLDKASEATREVLDKAKQATEEVLEKAKDADKSLGSTPAPAPSTPRSDD